MLDTDVHVDLLLLMSVCFMYGGIDHKNENNYSKKHALPSGSRINIAATIAGSGHWVRQWRQLPVGLVTAYLFFLL